MAVKYRGDQGALRIFLQEQFFGTDHTWTRAEIHVRRLESHLMRFYQQWDVERETIEIQKQVKMWIFLFFVLNQTPLNIHVNMMHALILCTKLRLIKM